jgi:type I restriction enzyme R subunit
MKKLRKYAESHDYAIQLKTEIMIVYFHEQVITLIKIEDQARTMIVTDRGECTI